VTKADLAWLPRLASVTTMNTPHYGTPLAAFFATVSGQRMLYAISALTVTALKLGAPPLAATSALVAAFGRLSIGNFELEIVNRAVDTVAKVLDEASSRELRSWLDLLRGDQGAIVQLMPEAMDVFQAGVEDRPGVRYQCVATYAPQNAVKDWLSAFRSPWGVMSATIFTALYNLTARVDERYPCAAADGSAQAQLKAMLGEVLPPGANDGVVPLLSQIWGDLVWVGKADHLDIVGHFPGPGGHTDWLASGARFQRVRFDVVMDRVIAGMIVGEELLAARAPVSERAPKSASPGAPS
jgi:triacylglycerol lipase